MSSARLPGLCAAAGAVLLVSACSSMGDLGRPKQATPVSSFVAVKPAGLNETDEEQQMHDRVWRFLQAPHVKAWFGRSPAKVSDYYGWLTGTYFRSSRTRFASVNVDIEADLGTIPATFEAICAVEEIDRRRGVALAGLQLEPEMAEGVGKRRAANEAEIDRFTYALGFRYDSYAYALDRILVETPHEEARVSDAALNELALYVNRAERGEFCMPAVTLGPPIEIESDQAPILPQTSSDSAAS